MNKLCRTIMKYWKYLHDNLKLGDFSAAIPNASRNGVSLISHLVFVLLSTTLTEILLENLAQLAKLNSLYLLLLSNDAFDALSLLLDRSVSSLSFFKQLWKIPAYNDYNLYNFNKYHITYIHYIILFKS